MRRYGIAIKPIAPLYEGPYEMAQRGGETVSAVTDEALYGMGVVLTEAEHERDGYVAVETSYRYLGYCRTEDLRIVREEELTAWERSNLMVIDGFCVDIVSFPKVSGVRLASLYRGSLVEVTAFNTEREGWARVRLADGRTGYMRNRYLKEKEFSQAGLWTGTLPQKRIVDEQAFRRAVTETAVTYLGVQYRWGGKSTAGIDCSGLTSVSYMQNGILTFRDARIEDGFPIREISREQILPGDLMYFPGHIAMYLGNGKYIHSSGSAGGVVINSLCPEAEDYREDLADSLCAVGSFFKSRFRR